LEVELESTRKITQVFDFDINKQDELVEKISDQENSSQVPILIDRQKVLWDKIKDEEVHLQELVTVAKSKLKSQDYWISASKREEKTKERELLLELFLNNSEKITDSQKELLERKMNKGELDELCKAQKGLVELKTELENLEKKNQQAQVLQIETNIFKSNN